MVGRSVLTWAAAATVVALGTVGCKGLMVGAAVFASGVVWGISNMELGGVWIWLAAIPVAA